MQHVKGDDVLRQHCGFVLTTTSITINTAVRSVLLLLLRLSFSVFLGALVSWLTLTVTQNS